MNTNIIDFFMVSLSLVDIILLVYVLLIAVFFGFVTIGGKNLPARNRYKKYEKVYQVSNIFSTKELSDFNKSTILIELDNIADENSSGPLQVYTIIETNDKNLSYDLIHHNQHIKFLTAYRNQRWDMAITIANSLKTSYDGSLKKYYHMMIGRCQYYKKNPPKNDWNGIWNRTS